MASMGIICLDVSFGLSGGFLVWYANDCCVTGKDDALQRGMDNLGKNGCTNDVCSALKIQDAKDAIACTIPSRVNEDVGVKGNCEYPMGSMYECWLTIHCRAQIYSRGCH